MSEPVDSEIVAAQAINAIIAMMGPKMSKHATGYIVIMTITGAMNTLANTKRVRFSNSFRVRGRVAGSFITPDVKKAVTVAKFRKNKTTKLSSR
jgi:hypothetical protein